jgi:hypothetical protein
VSDEREDEPATPRQTDDPPRIPPHDPPDEDRYPRLPDREGESDDEDAGSPPASL